jgi:hypothetical protein
MGYDSILDNVIPHLREWWRVIHIIFYALGFGLLVFSLGRYPRDKRQEAGSRALLGTVVGVILLNTPAFLNAMATTVFNQDSIESLTYSPPAHEAQTYVQFSVYVVALVGLIGIGRGVYMLKRSSSEGGQFERGVVHIFGGILCVNFVEFLRILGVTLGGDIDSVVRFVIG